MPGRTRAQRKAICGENGLKTREKELALSYHLGSLSMMDRTAFVLMMEE